MSLVSDALAWYGHDEALEDPYDAAAFAAAVVAIAKEDPGMIDLCRMVAEAKREMTK